MNRKEARRLGLQRHHQISRSAGGLAKPDNVVWVSPVDHRRYHALFENRDLTQAIGFLIDTFGKGDYRWLRPYKKFIH